MKAVPTGRKGMHDDVPVMPIVITKASVVEVGEGFTPSRHRGGAPRS